MHGFQLERQCPNKDCRMAGRAGLGTPLRLRLGFVLGLGFGLGLQFGLWLGLG